MVEVGAVEADGGDPEQPVGPDGHRLDGPLRADHEFLRRNPFWGFSNHGSAWAAGASSRPSAGGLVTGAGAGGTMKAGAAA